MNVMKDYKKEKKRDYKKTPPMFIIYLRRFDKRLVICLGVIFSIIALSLLIFLISSFIKSTVKMTKNITSSILPKETRDYTEDVLEWVQKLDDNKSKGALDEFKNLGIVICDSYINLRSEPDEKNTRAIIGKMDKYAACDVLDEEVKENPIYAKVKSGGMTGYVAKKYLVMGDDAIKIANENIKQRAEVLVTKLWMRSEPTSEGDTQIGATYKGERYAILERLGDWILVEADNVDGYEKAYISGKSEYVQIKYSLNVARTQDLKNDVLNYYDTIGISIAKSYVNIRSTAKDSGTSNIIGKLPKHAGCEILSQTGSWYKIRSGRVTGYVTKEYIATGKTAEKLALEYADLRAIVKIDALRVRTKPSTTAKAWTTIAKEETYIVKDQLDGWVEIEIDGAENNKNDSGYISTLSGYVEVRYALEHAIEYKPAEIAKLKISTKRRNIINYAIQFVGNPYVWGGTSLTNGSDCSGFVQSVFKKYGVSLPRVSSEQAKRGVARTSANRQAGDLIFYAGADGVVNHVAIYIGNNQVVHAASTKSGIKISNWNYRTPVAIRNILGN
ncbi:MAG: C40 family peptidase [Eubacteriales bacterium]|nr:C40 family peptidase [Eubacteriales bacterium]